MDTEKTCPVCGNVFTARSETHVYCTKECKRKAAIKRARMTRICPICKGKFIKGGGNQIYCCEACRKRADIFRKNHMPEVLFCMNCGKSFIPKNNAQRVCSVECYKAIYNEKRRAARAAARKTKAKTCPVCKKTFYTQDTTRVYCSFKCMEDANRKRAKQEYYTKPKKTAPAKPIAREKPGRHCHDCGEPTTDYRCPACWTKWRKKHGVSPIRHDDGLC